MYQVTNIQSFISKKRDPKGVTYFHLRCVQIIDGLPDLNFQFDTILTEQQFNDNNFVVGDVVIPLVSPASSQGDYKVRGIVKQF